MQYYDNFEEWRDLEGYNGYYKVSNYGRVMSLHFGRCKILKAVKNNHGYLKLTLHKEGNVKTFNVHQLVAISFLSHKPCGLKLVVNHIDFNRENNFASNLEIVTNRENTNQKHLISSSVYTGVSWNKKSKKWESRIRIKGKKVYLGMFYCEFEASKAYQNALSKLK